MPGLQPRLPAGLAGREERKEQMNGPDQTGPPRWHNDRLGILAGQVSIWTAVVAALLLAAFLAAPGSPARAATTRPAVAQITGNCLPSDDGGDNFEVSSVYETGSLWGDYDVSPVIVDPEGGNTVCWVNDGFANFAELQIFDTDYCWGWDDTVQQVVVQVCNGLSYQEWNGGNKIDCDGDSCEWNFQNYWVDLYDPTGSGDRGTYYMCDQGQYNSPYFSVSGCSGGEDWWRQDPVSII
jgi:hypothetical protein